MSVAHVFCEQGAINIMLYFAFVGGDIFPISRSKTASQILSFVTGRFSIYICQNTRNANYPVSVIKVTFQHYADAYKHCNTVGYTGSWSHIIDHGVQFPIIWGWPGGVDKGVQRVFGVNSDQMVRVLAPWVKSRDLIPGTWLAQSTSAWNNNIQDYNKMAGSVAAQALGGGGMPFVWRWWASPWRKKKNYIHIYIYIIPIGS